MPVYELARFKVAPSDVSTMLQKRDRMVDAIRSRFPGLIQASLARLDEETWIDVWRWDSMEQAKAASETAPQIPDAAEMFSLIKEVVAMEHAEIAHEA